MAGHPDFAGTPLVHGIDILSPNQSVSLPAGGSGVIGPFQVNRPGYLINAQAVYSGANGNNPLCSMIVEWFDATQSTHFGQEAWRFPAGSNGNGYFHIGRGPTKGQLVQATFINRDQTQPMQALLWLAQTTQHASRDDIRLRAAGASPVFTDVNGSDPTYNRLASYYQVSVPGTSSNNYLLPLYSGQAQIRWSVTGVTAGATFSIFISQADALNPFASDYALTITGPTGNSGAPALITLPRKVCFLTIENDGAAAATLFLSMTAQEYSS